MQHRHDHHQGDPGGSRVVRSDSRARLRRPDRDRTCRCGVRAGRAGGIRASRPDRGGRPAAPVSYCGSPADQGGISVNADTSCPFAENVESAWESSGGASVTAYSPVTGLAYTMSCTASGTGYEVCTGGDNAYVEFPVTAASAPASASGQFDSPCTQCAVSTLSQSVANEQQAALEDAPSDDYDSADNPSVNVALTALGDNTYSATATDSDGDAAPGTRSPSARTAAPGRTRA